MNVFANLDAVYNGARSYRWRYFSITLKVGGRGFARTEGNEMVVRQVTDVLLVLLLTQAAIESDAAKTEIPAFLQEPSYFIEKQSDKWAVKKPGLRILEPAGSRSPRAWTIFEDTQRATVERRMKALPRLRLNRALVEFNPLTRQRTLIVDWKDQGDAQEIGTDIQALLDRFAPPAAKALFSSIPLYMARLSGATGHTAEEWNDHQRFVMYLDPFRATGRLHAASTLIHELSHAERYRMRGFHGNRAAAVLPKPDFILLGASDELAAYQTEATLVTSFLNSIASEALRQAVSAAMPSGQLRWPTALTVLLGFAGPSDPTERMREVRARILLELESQAGRYWDIHHKDSLPPTLATTIRDWYSQSREWRDIAAQRADWRDAGARMQGPSAR
jgi:hypothetical protein